MKRIFLTIALILCTLSTYAEETEKLYLSGTGADDMVQWDFLCSNGHNSGQWSKIGVPSQWELQGFGEYTYGRFYFNDKDARPSTETGLYRYKFSVPASWKGKMVDIVFDGVMTDALVKINGKVAGKVHQGAFYRFRYRVTDLIRFGAKNSLEVLVKKESDNESVNSAERRADWWLFGGIFRPVWLEAKPQANISNIAFDPQADGTLSAVIETESAPEGSHVKYELRDKDNMSLGVKSIPLSAPQVMKWEDIKPWECEHPHLYEISATLISPEGKELHKIIERIGFRTVELRPADGLYINNTKVVLKGVNRHCFHPESGRTTTYGTDLEDALLVKEMNMNAIRSHYPPDERFLDICDSLGIFYLDELAGWHGRYDNEVGPLLLEEMVRRDVNHPCVIIWDNGNEGGWNYGLDALFAKYDPQNRHVIHPWADFNNLDTHHYPAYLTGVHKFTNGFKVFMPTEFLHANYDEGAGAGLEDFWSNYCSHPLFAGGFIWALLDEAVVRTDKGGILDSYGNMGNDGILGPYREKEGSFWTVRNIWSPVQFKNIFINSSFNGDLIVSNGFLFTNLSECSYKYRLFRVTTPSEKASKVELASGGAGFPSVEPGLTGRLHIELPDNFFDGDLFELEAYGPDGKAICTWTWPVHLAADYISRHRINGTAGLDVKFNKETGEIERIVKNGRTIPLKNVKPVGMKWKFIDASERQEGEDRVFVAHYKGGVDSVVWRVTSDGRLGMDALILNRANGGGGLDDAFMDTDVKNLGFTFDFPEDYIKGLEWFGRGPYRVWKNRIRGHEYGLWSKNWNNTITAETDEPYGKLQYPEFKGYHANVYWASFISDNVPFTVYSETDGLFLRVFTPEQPRHSDGRTSNPEFPDGDISLLLDIPAIKSFKPVSQHGPKSQPGNIRIKSGDEGIRIKVWFDFSDEPELKEYERPEPGSSRKGDNPVLFLTGDSTMRNGSEGNGKNGQWGWGYFLPQFFDPERITVENHALGGMSSRTYYNNCWNTVIQKVNSGDYVIIQLGHNDSGPLDEGRARNSLPGTGRDSLLVTHKQSGRQEYVYSYGEYIRRMAKDVQARHGTPVIMSPTPRPFWTDEGKIIRKTETISKWAKEVAEELGAVFIDLENISANEYEAFGKEKTSYMFYGDTIHTSEYGASENAACAVQGIIQNDKCGLKDYLLPPPAKYPREKDKPILFLVGDSTMKNNDSDKTSMWGWGSVLSDYFDTRRIGIVNAGKPGRSARTFLEEGRWDKVYNSICPGDYVVIQFGHNDIGPICNGKERAGFPGATDSTSVFRMVSDGRYRVIRSYGWYLNKFIQDVREKGGLPILVSLTPRNEWCQNHIERRNDSYGRWLGDVVKKSNVPFVDLHNISADFFDSIGEDCSASYFKNDHTHTSWTGANRNAESFVEGIKAISHPLSKYLK